MDRTGENPGSKCLFALIVAAVVTTSVVMGDVQRKERAVQEHLAEEVLRFHVLANSDSRTDQAVKMEVRDAVLSYLKKYFLRNWM